MVKGIIVLLESQNGELKRSSREAIGYAYRLSQQLDNTPVYGYLYKLEELNMDSIKANAKGLNKIFVLNSRQKHYEFKSAWEGLKHIIDSTGSTHIVSANSNFARLIAPLAAVHIQAPLISTILQDARKEDQYLLITRSVYSGKAEATVKIPVDRGIHLIMPNAVEPAEADATPEVELLDIPAPVSWKIEKVEKAEGKVPLTEAQVVVSGGRGMKGPENWYLLEELAEELGAALACSKPVTDMGWRPHSEHVGQTGLTIRPTVYFAIGISGAIQHMAGVNGSKYIIAINKDPEAPIFKYASYGIVGDLFEVVPKLTEAIRKFKKAREKS